MENNTKPSFACVLRTGGDYKPEHVIALKKQVDFYTTVPYQFICYSDIEIEGIKTIPLEKNYPGWWSVPEVFRNQGPTIVVGIDTVIYSNIDKLLKIALETQSNEFWMIRAFARSKKYASGIMIWNSDWSWLWKEFDYEKAVNSLDGEQDYTVQKLLNRGIKPKIIQDSFKGVYSYKRHCREKGIPEDTTIILFHGKPRPFDVPSIWNGILNLESDYVERIWPDSTAYILGGGPSLNNVNFDLIKDKNVIGVNQAFSLGDWVDICFSGDKRWYWWNYKKLRKYKGKIYTCYPEFIPNKDCRTINLSRISGYGISDKSPYSIMWNGNSGATTINLAYWLGCNKVVLLGFDHKRDKQTNKYNWHDDYPEIKRNKDTQRFPNPYSTRFAKCWRQVAIDAKSLGIEIVNATPDSKIKVFPYQPLEELV